MKQRVSRLKQYIKIKEHRQMVSSFQRKLRETFDCIFLISKQQVDDDTVIYTAYIYWNHSIV